MNNNSKRRTDGTSKNNWRTPPWLWERLQAEFQFEVDGASDGMDNLLPEYHTHPKNGEDIRQQHSDYLTKKIFINPPFDQLRNQHIWLNRCFWLEKNRTPPQFACFLIPFAPETRHWHAWVWPYATIFVFNKRINYVVPGTDKIQTGIATPSCLAIYSQEPVDTKKMKDLGVWVKKI